MGRSRIAAAVLGLVLFLVVTDPAAADTSIAVLGDTLFVSAEGQNNSMEFKVVNQKYRTVDSGSILVPGGGCVREPPADATTVDCTGNLFKAIVGLGDGKDDFTPANYIQLEIAEDGEGGEDQLTGGLSDDTLRGNAGDDYSDGGGGDDFLSDGYAGTLGGGLGSGDDYLVGNAGDDFLDGGSFAAVPDAGSGADVLEGGLGVDTADYSKRTAPLSLTEGDGANDGQDTGAGTGSEADNIVNAETIVGGSAGDLIAGADGDNTLSGGAGNDALHGARGTDTLRGGNGDDSLDGGAGADLLQGGHGVDTASYAQRSTPVSISLDSAANDGAPGEGDNVDQGTEERRGRIGRRHFPDDRRCHRQGHLRRGRRHGLGRRLQRRRRRLRDGESQRAARRRHQRSCSDGPPETAQVRHGVAHLKVTCPPSALGGCAKGRVAVLAGKKTLATAPFTVAAGESVAVALRFGRRAQARMAKLRYVTLAVSAVGAAPATQRAALAR